MKAMQFVLAFAVASSVVAGCSKQAPETGQPAQAEQPALSQDQPSGQASDRLLDTPSGTSLGGSSYTSGSNTGKSGSITMQRPGGGPPIILPAPNLNGTLSGIPTAPQVTIVEPAPIAPAPEVERAIPPAARP